MTHAPAIGDLSPRAKLEILGAILLAMFLFALDQTVVGTALPVIVTDLHGDKLYTWSVTVYLLTATISGPIYGKLSDLFGRRPIFIFALGLFLVAPVLSGLSNKQSAGAQWTDPAVAGLMALGIVIGIGFIWVELRAKDPIVRLELFRNRSFSVSVAAMFLAAFGFFGAIIFLPRWFQVVAGTSATESGYSLLPLLFALIVSATVSGQLVARTGHYKALIAGSMVILAVGLFLLTNLRTDTDRLTLALWMVVVGLGIGPSFAVFTLFVPNAVAPKVIGVATSSLTFFQQIGGTIGLTIAGTIFGDTVSKELPIRLAAAGVPQQFLSQLGTGGSLDLFGTGDLGAKILAATPPAFQPVVQPLIPGIVQAVHDSISLGIASTYWVSIVAAAIAAICVLFLKEQPMRETFEMDAEEAAATAG